MCPPETNSATKGNRGGSAARKGDSKWPSRWCTPSTGRASEGIDFLKRATDLKPAEALYWNNLAACYLATSRLAEAVDAARKAVILEPGYAAAWSRLGDAYSDLKDFARARDAYERYEAMAGSELSVQKRLANCLINLGDLGKAETRNHDLHGLGEFLYGRQCSVSNSMGRQFWQSGSEREYTERNDDRK